MLGRSSISQKTEDVVAGLPSLNPAPAKGAVVCVRDADDEESPGRAAPLPSPTGALPVMA